MSTSLYAKTDNDGYYRDYYQPLDLGYDESDFILIVTSDYNQKPGKLAQDLYGNPRYSWVFGYFNPNQISDLIFDLKEGLILRLPTKERLLNSL